jgi:hypothetical protein
MSKRIPVVANWEDPAACGIHSECYSGRGAVGPGGVAGANDPIFASAKAGPGLRNDRPPFGPTLPHPLEFASCRIILFWREVMSRVLYHVMRKYLYRAPSA